MVLVGRFPRGLYVRMCSASSYLCRWRLPQSRYVRLSWVGFYLCWKGFHYMSERVLSVLSTSHLRLYCIDSRSREILIFPLVPRFCHPECHFSMLKYKSGVLNNVFQLCHHTSYPCVCPMSWLAGLRLIQSCHAISETLQSRGCHT